MRGAVLHAPGERRQRGHLGQAAEACRVMDERRATTALLRV